MKRPFLYILTFLLLLSGLWACRGSSSGDVKKALDQLHAACKADDHKTAADFIAYKFRKDKARRYKDTLKVADEDELNATKKTCARVLKNMDDGFEIVEHKMAKESEGTWHVIIFKSGGGKGAFAFLRHGDSFMLGDID